MGANEHSSHTPAAAHRTAERGGQEPSGGSDTAEARRLIDRAGQLRLRAPEMMLVLAQRAAAMAESAGSNAVWVQAEGLAVLANIRLGHRAGTVGRAVAALRAAEDAGDDVLAVRLRAALAVCARSVGVPLTGFAVLRPALSVAGVPGAHRAVALSQLAGCVAGVAGKPELDKVVAEADRLCSADSTLDSDSQLVVRALLRVSMSAHRRRHGDLVGAADAARTGIGFLDGLADSRADGGVARTRLVLELATSLLDRGEVAVALDAATPVLTKPLRAAEVAPAAWLRLAVATRVHLPSGAGYAATRLLRDAVHDTDRHNMRALSARLNAELAHVEEHLHRPAEALHTLRRARADERAHARLRGRAYAVLTSEFGLGERPRVDFAEILADPKQAVTAPAQAAGDDTREQAARADTPARTAPVAAAQDTAPAADRSDSPAAQAGSGTRHAEQTSGSRASVLDRLGIASGSSPTSGGRRRAVEAGPSPETAAPDQPEPERSAAEAPMPDPGPTPQPEKPPTSQTGPSSGHGPAQPAEPEEDWLPRLRLPPTLAPIEELVADLPQSAEPGRDAGAQQPAAASGAPSTAAESTPAAELANEEPPEDAGLAELLTRALAEHQAGTSSAAALVKRLGSGDEPADGSPHVNGRHREDH